LIDREDAAALDSGDPLREFRNRFMIDEGLVYLDGNSLGPLARSVEERLHEVIRSEWGGRLIRAWDEGWLELPVVIGDQLAALLGAAPGQVVIGDSTTVCLYKLIWAALELRPGRRQIVTDVDNFPTDRYVVEGIAAARGLELVWLRGDPVFGVSAESVAEVVGSQTALVTLSHVSYHSAAIADMASINRIAREAGAVTLWDLCHTAGAVPVELDRSGTDLAVGCTYKYLNGGPGAPAFMYVTCDLVGRLRQPIWGWLGRRDPFEMGAGYVPGEGVRALLSGTPPVLALTAVAEGVRVVMEAGIDAVRAKGIALTELAIALVDELAEFGFNVASPRDASRRGAHVAVSHPDAHVLCAGLIERGVIVDFRRPDVIRLGLSPLVTRFVDVWDAVAVLRELVTTRPG
jgi:kynureninase